MKHFFTAFSLVLACGSLAQNDLTMNMTCDRYGDETRWRLRDAAGTLITSGGPYSDSGTNGAYPQSPVAIPGLADGAYSLIVADAYGDGNCCAYGNGEYSLMHDQSGILISGGAIAGYGDSIPFLLPPPPPPVGEPTAVTITLVPWAEVSSVVDIAHAGDPRIFVAEQPGVIRIVADSGDVLAVPFLDIQDRVNDDGNEQGLLGLAFDPDYADNGYFYVNYIFGAGSGTSRISRFSVTEDPNVADPASEVVLYSWPQPYTNHNGGDLAFGPDGFLYCGFGDGGSGGDPQNHAQTLTDPLGDMIRIDVNGAPPYTVPATNPHVGSAGGELPEIWASGLRNPWRFGFDVLTGDLWVGDVGQNAVEEVDFWPAGDNSGPNFGWRCYEGNSAYNTAGCAAQSSYIAPVAEHTHGEGWCSVIGGRVYRGTEYPRLHGRYIYTDYCQGDFWTLRPDGQGGFTDERVLSSGMFGWQVLAEDVDNALYAANSNGLLYRIEDPCPYAPPVITVTEVALTSTPAEAYFWYFNGGLIDGATDQTYVPLESGSYSVVAQLASGCLLQSEPVDFVYTGMGAFSSMDLLIAPNPANEALEVHAAREWPSGARVVLLDATGREVVRAGVPAVSTVRLATAALRPGAYAVQVRTADGHVLAVKQVAIMH